MQTAEAAAAVADATGATPPVPPSAEAEAEAGQRSETEAPAQQTQTRPCSTPGCGQPSTLTCPTCPKLGLPAVPFCSQQCFKGYWGEHKKVHQAARQRMQRLAMPPEFASFAQEGRFTGSLRPAGRSPMRVLPPNIARPDYAATGISREEEMDRASHRTLKVYAGEELEAVRNTCRLGREVLECGAAAVAAGVTTDEIDRIVHEACIERECYPSPLNYNFFPKSLCTSVNEVICHGIPDFRELRNGDIVNLDVSVYHGGYHADLNETYFVGDVDDEGRMLVETAYNCLKAAVDQVAPGMMYRDVGKHISKAARNQGCSVVRTYCGHGVGTLFHTAPTIPHYSKNKAKGIMREGHVFTIEPMVNLGDWHDETWPDNWTAVTVDGRRSAQFEHTMVVTDDGYDLLTAREGETEMVWDAERFQR